jgi:alcohol dehydrogenase
MIANALGAQVVAVDISDDALAMARDVGAVATVNARETTDVVEAVREATHGGAHVSLDALGSPDTCFHSVANLRKRGRHVQVGLLVGDNAHTAVPMDRVVADELEILGTHGIQAHRYPALFDMIAAGTLQPDRLVSRTLSLHEAGAALASMDAGGSAGVSVIDDLP